MDKAYQLEQRKKLISKIANTYIYDYVQAQLTPGCGNSLKEIDKTNAGLISEIEKYDIAMVEFKKAVEEIEYRARTENLICSYPLDLFSTKFFKN